MKGPNLHQKLWGIALAVGIIAGLWQVSVLLYQNSPLSVSFPLTNIGIAAFIGWSSFCLLGSRKSDFLKGVSHNYVGVLWGMAMVALWTLIGRDGWQNYLGAFIGIGLGGAGIVLTANIRYLNSLPAMFLGSTAFVACGGVFTFPVVFTTFLGLALGAVLGIVSGSLGNFFNHKFFKEKSK